MSITVHILLAFLLAGPRLHGETPYVPRVPLGHDAIAYLEKIPAENPSTPAKVELGKLLFFDKRLSADGTIACASCHQPRYAFTDGRALPVGIEGRLGKRNTPTILNRAYGVYQFLDGRAASLEDQALQPLASPQEMGNTLENVVATLAGIEGYGSHFEAAFGSPEVTARRISLAIAAFERTLLTGESPFDVFEYGGPEGALSPSGQRGLALFRGKAGCTVCHTPPTYTDEDFHNIGAGWDRADLTIYSRTKNPNDIEGVDPGRFALTAEPVDFGAIKTPTLRDVARTAPYTHDGDTKTLEDVVEFYNKGGIKNPFLDPNIEPLNLTDAEKRDLVTFLKSLSGTNWLDFEPPLQFPE